jgi:hypothetical protein
LPVVGKRTLVEQIAQHPAAADTRAPRPGGASTAGVPRLQREDIAAQPSGSQDFRVITDLPEPTAKLHQVVGVDTAEQLAAKEYGTSG